MAKMNGKRLTLLQPKNILLRLNESQVHNIVDGLIENRKTVTESDIDLYDSLTLDTIEQLEQFGMHYPDLVLGEDQSHTPEDIAKVKEELRLIGNKFVQLHKIMTDDKQSHEQKLKIVRTGLHDLYGVMVLLFGEEEANVLTGRDRS